MLNADVLTEIKERMMKIGTGKEPTKRELKKDLQMLLKVVESMKSIKVRSPRERHGKYAS